MFFLTLKEPSDRWRKQTQRVQQTITALGWNQKAGIQLSLGGCKVVGESGERFSEKVAPKLCLKE